MRPWRISLLRCCDGDCRFKLLRDRPAWRFACGGVRGRGLGVVTSDRNPGSVWEKLCARVRARTHHTAPLTRSELFAAPLPSLVILIAVLVFVFDVFGSGKFGDPCRCRCDARISALRNHGIMPDNPAFFPSWPLREHRCLGFLSGAILPMSSVCVSHLPHRYGRPNLVQPCALHVSIIPACSFSPCPFPCLLPSLAGSSLSLLLPSHACTLGRPILDASILTMCKLSLQIIVLRCSSFLALFLRVVAAQSSRPAPAVYRRYRLPDVVASAAPRYIQQETLLDFLPLAFSHAAMLCLMLRQFCHHVERSAVRVLGCRGLRCGTFTAAPMHGPCVWPPCRIHAALVMWLHMTIPTVLLLLCGMCLELVCLVS